MPYNNAYNQGIKQKMQNLYANHVNHENAMNDNTVQNDVMGPLEGMALRHEEVQGGNGTGAATLQDLGYEQLNGATGNGEPTDTKPKRKTYKTMKVSVPSAMDSDPSATAGGVSAGGVSAGGVSAGGVSAGGVSGGTSFGDIVRGTVGALGHATGLNRILPTDYVAAKITGGTKKRARKPKVEGGNLLDTVKDIADTVLPFAPLLLGLGEPKEEVEKHGGARKPNARAEIVRRIMKEKGMKLMEASKYVKEHGLYKKGGALLSTASMDSMRPNQGPQTYTTGGVTNTV